MSLSANPIEKYQFIHNFVPHPYHKRRATLLSSNALVLYSLVAVVFFLVLKLIPHAFPGVLGYASNIDVQTLLQDTNEVRQEHGLAPLKLNQTLSKAAEQKAQHMFKEDYWAHISPSGVKPWDFILNQGYDYTFAGENLAKNFMESDQVVEAWYESPTHRENLLSANYNEIGFAVVNGVLNGYETTLVVQMFGTSRTPSYVASVSNPPSVPATANIESELQPQQPVTTSEKPIQNVSVPAEVNSMNQRRTFTIDVANLSKAMLAFFITFILVLLFLDIWYTKKKSIPKFTGHTFAHIGFLVIVLGGVWLFLTPGAVL